MWTLIFISKFQNLAIFALERSHKKIHLLSGTKWFPKNDITNRTFFLTHLRDRCIWFEESSCCVQDHSSLATRFGICSQLGGTWRTRIRFLAPVSFLAQSFVSAGHRGRQLVVVRPPISSWGRHVPTSVRSGSNGTGWNVRLFLYFFVVVSFLY